MDSTNPGPKCLRISPSFRSRPPSNRIRIRAREPKPGVAPRKMSGFTQCNAGPMSTPVAIRMMTSGTCVKRTSRLATKASTKRPPRMAKKRERSIALVPGRGRDHRGNRGILQRPIAVTKTRSGPPSYRSAPVARACDVCRPISRRAIRAVQYRPEIRHMNDSLVIAGRAFQSRLIVGTGKYRSHAEMQRAHEASGAEHDHRRRPPREPHRPLQGVPARLHRPRQIRSCFRIPPAATTPKKPSARRASAGKWAFRIGSSSK